MRYLFTVPGTAKDLSVNRLQRHLFVAPPVVFAAPVHAEKRAGRDREGSTPARLIGLMDRFRGYCELRTAWRVDAVRPLRMDYFETVYWARRGALESLWLVVAVSWPSRRA